MAALTLFLDFDGVLHPDAVYLKGGNGHVYLADLLRNARRYAGLKN